MEAIQKTCFVIGPIGASGSPTRKAADLLLKSIIKPAIIPFLNVKVWRADEDNQPGMITDKLINDLLESDLVIADLSEVNPNAFYELGIRHAAERPTIHMAAVGTKLPFDNSGHRTIFFDLTDYDSCENARSILRDQCEEALSDSFTISNPVVQAISVKAFRASPMAEKNMIAEIMERLEAIESKTVPSVVEMVPRPVNDRTKKENLLGAIKNFSRSELGTKLRITNSQIESFVAMKCGDEDYWRIMQLLKSGHSDVVLREVANEIPF
jgi:hypothetical protein